MILDIGSNNTQKEWYIMMKWNLLQKCKIDLIFQKQLILDNGGAKYPRLTLSQW